MTSLRAARIESTRLRDIMITIVVSLLLLLGAMALTTYGRTGHDCHDCDDYVPLYYQRVPS